MGENSFDLSGKVAVITGASRGLGQIFGRALAKVGADLVITSRKLDSLTSFKTEIEALGRKAVPLELDVLDHDSIRKMMDTAWDEYGKVDILVNNAAVLFNTLAPVVEVTENEFDVVFALNARGAFFAMQEAARRLPDCSRIINISAGVAKTRMLEDLFALWPPEMKTILIQRTLMGRLGQPADVADAAAS